MLENWEGFFMQGVLKTREVSEQLGVNPTTVQRWVKYFNIHCDINEQGHYLFSMPQVEVLREIKGQLNMGKKLKEINLGQPEEKQQVKKNTEMVQTQQYERKLEQMMSRIDILENKLNQKADEVVSYQISSHRKEIDEMMGMLKKLEQRMDAIELGRAEKQSSVENINIKEKKPKKRSFVQLFSL